MSLVDGLLHQVIDSIDSVTIDMYGDTTATTVYTNVKCRWTTKIEHLVNNNNELVTTTAKVFLLPDYSDIGYSHKITKDSIIYSVQLIKNNRDLDGVLDHIVLYLN